MKKIISFELEYNPKIKYYKTSYNGLSLVNYINNNYISNIKSKQIIIGYIYYLNRAAVS